MPTTAAHPRHRRREDGSASIELVILFPALLALVTALLQYGLWFYARSLALAAAQQGVATARSYNTDPGTGRDVALAFIDQHGADTLLDPTATSVASPGQVQVVVTGRSLSVLPGVDGPTVTQAATGPIERFVPGGSP
ncbi:TadE/TadG family type IV pilus assembly protein [Cellulomonas sp. McL0617]|uniref:TadE/TadG family type IV pilus assembly protein n=1 Tax=Cellulomonas sp. McL0617 TaxID=3415675 RepID=UPI003CF43453